MTFIALLLSFSQHVTVTLVASLFSFLAALLTLIAFAIDIALFAFTKHEMNKLNIGASTITGPGTSFPLSPPHTCSQRHCACRLLADVRHAHPAAPRGLHRLLRAQARPHVWRGQQLRHDVQAVLETLPPELASRTCTTLLLFPFQDPSVAVIYHVRVYTALDLGSMHILQLIL